MMALLEIEQLSVRYGGNHALQLDGMALQAGTLTGVVGGNGAGKSTLVNSLLNWSRGRPRITGTVRLNGVDISRLPPAERARLGLLLVPEGSGVFYNMTVEENLRSVLPPPDRESRSIFTIAQVLEMFPRLGERMHHAGSALSGGERQMLALSRALLAGPRILLLDEPSIGLAPQLVLTLLKTVRRLVDEGLTVLLVEQNVRAALEVVDHLYLFERGRLLAGGTPDEMRNHPQLIEAYLGGAAEQGVPA